MSEAEKIPSILGEAFIGAIRLAVREEMKANHNGHIEELLTPQELAKKLKVPETWVYEQSRQNKIPTHRLGSYIRFDLAEVLAFQKKE